MIILGRKTRWMTILLLCWLPMATWAEVQDSVPQPIIEQQGDRYVINVEAMNPDSEMSLMDLLQLCPEMTTTDGKQLADNFTILIDNFDFYLDEETFLEQVKACEISSISIYTNPCVTQGLTGTEGVIDITFKNSEQNGTHGKAAIEGNTYGNGKLYGDVTMQRRDFSLKGYALANQHYGKASTTENYSVTGRSLVENAHISMDWNISDVDNLKVKIDQKFVDMKQKWYEASDPTEETEKNRLGTFALGYTRTLNDKGTTLETDIGLEYVNIATSDFRYDILPYLEVQFCSPVLKDLALTAGYNMKYENIRTKETRLQSVQNELYAQFNYTHGPWVVTLGALLSRLDYWHRINGENKDAQYKNDFSMLAVAGYKWGRHYIQGGLEREFYVALFENDDDEDEEDNWDREYEADEVSSSIGHITYNIWKAEARYTYQHKNFSLLGSVFHRWTANTPTQPEKLTGLRTSCTWHQKNWRLTAGAGYYHQYMRTLQPQVSYNDDFFILKLSPILLLGKGFRLSSSLIYNSMQSINGKHGHLYCSIKVNKNIGRHCNVFAEFQDIAGMPTFSPNDLDYIYYQRALNIGMTYRF